MSKVSDVLTSQSYTKATEEQKTALQVAYDSISKALEGSGFRVLISQVEGDKQEFVPSARIDEVTAQKGILSGQIDKLNKQLLKLETEASENNDPTLVKKYQDMVKKNNKLKADMNAKELDHKIDLAVRELKPLDVDDFKKMIDRDAITRSEDGEILGLDEEMTRLRESKSYMLEKSDTKDKDRKKTFDKNNKKDVKEPPSINDMIRSAAGRGRAMTSQDD